MQVHDLTKLILEELQSWEQTKQSAQQDYLAANAALLALTRLTERMRQAVENEHQVDTSKRVAGEAEA